MLCSGLQQRKLCCITITGSKCTLVVVLLPSSTFYLLFNRTLPGLPWYFSSLCFFPSCPHNSFSYLSSGVPFWQLVVLLLMFLFFRTLSLRVLPTTHLRYFISAAVILPRCLSCKVFLLLSKLFDIFFEFILLYCLLRILSFHFH